jgi:hypothetical protein
VLTISKVLDGSFGGRVLYENPKYKSPNTTRSELKRAMGKKYVVRKRAERHTEVKKTKLSEAVPVDKLSHKQVFGSNN